MTGRGCLVLARRLAPTCDKHPWVSPFSLDRAGQVCWQGWIKTKKSQGLPDCAQSVQSLDTGTILTMLRPALPPPALAFGSRLFASSTNLKIITVTAISTSLQWNCKLSLPTPRFLSLLHVYLEIGLGLNPELRDCFSQRVRSTDMLQFMKAMNPVAEKGVLTSG